MRMRDRHKMALARISWSRAGLRHGSAALFHVLVFVSLLAVQFHAGTVPSSHMTITLPDERYYVDYALSVFHESSFNHRLGFILPLYPAWLAALMHIDPAFYDFLECVFANRHLHAAQSEAICRPLGNIAYYAQSILGTIGIALAWLAGWIASKRLGVAHLSALIALGVGRYAVHTTSFMTEALTIPLFAGVNVCLAWLVTGGGTLRRNAIVAIGCGITLGALILTRPPYEYLLLGLPFAAIALVFGDRHRRRAHAIALACILGVASLVVSPWVAYNYRTGGFVGLTKSYSSHVFSHRLYYNEMSWRQWAAAFPYWTHGSGPKLATRLFGEETVRYLDDREARRRRDEGVLLSKVSKEDSLAFLTARAWGNLPKHLAVSLPLAWRGMQPLPWFSIACWLLLIFSLVRGTRQNRRALLALLFCPAVILAINALVSLNIFRYNIGLVTPLSVGVALPIVWFIDGAWNRLRRRVRYWALGADTGGRRTNHGG